MITFGPTYGHFFLPAGISVHKITSDSGSSHTPLSGKAKGAEEVWTQEVRRPLLEYVVSLCRHGTGTLICLALKNNKKLAHSLT